MSRKIFNETSVIDEKTDIPSFIPPNRGWNYVSLREHPNDTHIRGNCGKWLLFVPPEDFIDTFRLLSTLAKEFELTHCFKASGAPERGTHVFCIYCGNYKDIAFVKKTARLLLEIGLLKKFGYKYSGGSSAIFFKTDETTHYSSDARGQSLTLFKFHEEGQLFVKKFIRESPKWELVNSFDSKITENFEDYLDYLQVKDFIDD